MSKATIILAGGLSRRFGTSKPFLCIDGKPLLSRSITLASRFSDEIVVAIGDTDSFERYKQFLSDSVRIVKDCSRQQSPLVGMYTGLRSVKSTRAMVLSCDLPFVNERVATFLLERTLQFDAAVPKWPNGNIEPLHSAFNVAEAKSATEKTLLMGQLRVSHMIDRLRNVAYVNVEEMRKLDNDLLTFFNVNTKTDLRKAEKIMKAL